MYKQSQNIDFKEINGEFGNQLFINDLVVVNADANTKVKPTEKWIEFNYIFTNLAKNLEKEASK